MNNTEFQESKDENLRLQAEFASYWKAKFENNEKDIDKKIIKFK